ncbi:hypothetical protein [Mycolicibacterium sediminis]|uniref:Lipoprotein n=1 Tax=Mycolicibacterium sediminis TaxID=1286180 RepID=A0A7I7QIQ2_9MYCO|nr:hypothetical protein [Mycolicibacterium sediminis]BBY26122.1 hypothetical protein MSEDJ_02180 [Mycolicibacterium sediminis]
MIRRALAPLLVSVAITSCGMFGPDPQAVSLPLAFGARVTDGELRLWTGSPCHDVTRVTVRFTSDAKLIFEPAPGRRADVDYLTLDGPNPGLRVEEALPDGFDWRTAEQVDLWIDGAAGEGSKRALVADIVAGSADHPEDTYWFQDVGWLGPDDVDELDGKTFLTPCTPDPARQPSLPPAFGVRVTDGALRIWTGSPCTDVNGVTLDFIGEPPGRGTTALTLIASDGPIEFDRFTLGEPLQGTRIAQELPAGFDWRSQSKLRLAVHTPNVHRDPTMDLAEVISGSASHPTTPTCSRASAGSIPIRSPIRTARRSSASAVPIRHDDRDLAIQRGEPRR